MIPYFPEYKEYGQLSKTLIEKLVLFRQYLDYPVTITAGWSSGTGHSSNSEHYNLDEIGEPCSLAVDISSRAPLLWLYSCAERAGFENIGVYPAFNGLHLGIRGNDKRRWIGLGTDNNQQYLTWNADNIYGVFTCRQ